MFITIWLTFDATWSCSSQSTKTLKCLENTTEKSLKNLKLKLLRGRSRASSVGRWAAREEKWMGIYDQFSLGRCQPCHQRDDLLQAIWSVSGRWWRWWERVWVWDSSTCLYRRLFEFSWNSNMFALFSMNWKIYKSTPSSPRQSVWCVDILSLEMWVLAHPVRENPKSNYKLLLIIYSGWHAWAAYI